MSYPAFSLMTTKIHNQSIMIVIDRYNSNNPTMTVTNGVEHVLKEIYSNIDTSRVKLDAIVYRDTEYEWAEIIVNNCKFVRFRPIPEELENILNNIPFDNLGSD